MIIKKVTTGYVTQQYDTEAKQWLSQEFIAGDEVDWEDENGNPTDPPEDFEDDKGWSSVDVGSYLPFNMVQPGDGVSTKLPFLITSPHDDETTLTGRILVLSEGIEVIFDGYGVQSMEPGTSGPIWIEVGENGDPDLVAWTDIQQEDCTHHITFENTKEALRID